MASGNQGAGDQTVNPQDLILVGNSNRDAPPVPPVPPAPLVPHGEILLSYPPTDFEALEERPLSPWAERYGFPLHEKPTQLFDKLTKRHSRLAPSRSIQLLPVSSKADPPMDPMFYGDEFYTFRFENFASKDEKDKFFYEDGHFSGLVAGIKPWQLGPMMHCLEFSRDVIVPGGHTFDAYLERATHREVYERELITVNEDSWLPFFKKDRWYGTVASDQELGINMWSVDDERIWKELRITIELANRMLNALIDERHEFLQTMLYGTLMYWDQTKGKMPFNPPVPEPEPFAKVLLSNKFSQSLWEMCRKDQPFPLSHVPNFDEDAWRTRLTSLLEKLTWGLGTIPNAAGRTGGLTFLDMQDPTILVNVDAIRSLIVDNLTLAERCSAQFSFTVTLLHELGMNHSACCVEQIFYLDLSPVMGAEKYMASGKIDFVNISNFLTAHALGGSRTRSDRNIDGLNELHPEDFTTPEPFVDYGGSAELGYAFEKAIFGAVFRDTTVWGPNFIAFAKYQVTWPFLPKGQTGNQGVMVSAEHPDFAPQKENTIWLIPATYCSRMLSEAFWNDETVPRKTDNGFHRITVFMSTTPNHPNATFWHRPPPSIQNRAELEALHAQGLLSKVSEITIVNWVEREKLWEEARAGWYEVDKLIYDGSAWAFATARHGVARFELEFRKHPNERNVFMLAFFAELMTKPVWTPNPGEFIRGLNGTGAFWPWIAVGFLMMAAMPIRTQGSTVPRLITSYHYWLYPSSAVPIDKAAPKNMTRGIPPEERLFGWVPNEYKPSELVDPTTRPGVTNIPPQAITHFDYLNVAANIIRHWMNTKTPIYTGWLNEIVRVERILRAQREREQASGPGSSGWADGWDFQVPEYDPLTRSVWDQERSAWVNHDILANPILGPV
ncbi:hypothetical protein GGR51DRAFT_559466 [Nemania sp. FL0031]|nr:hypothetical protein GGR51DRAFT_559466 [Nemania sp. FL0031]